MMASTLFFWLRLSSVGEKYKSAMCITGLVTFIAAYHYFRIFNSWVEAYEFPAEGGNPATTGKPFNDAYRYMDWLLTVPLLLIEISTQAAPSLAPSQLDRVHFAARYGSTVVMTPCCDDALSSAQNSLLPLLPQSSA